MTDATDGTVDPPSAAPPLRPGWYDDPSGRFEFRYHNGFEWTGDVSHEGARFVAPFDRTEPSKPPPADDGAPPPRNPIATAAMVTGICSLCLSWLPVLVVAGGVLAVLALVFGTIGRRRATELGLDANRAVVGLITGAIGLACVAVGVVLTVVLFRAVDRWENPAEHEVILTSCDGRTTESGTGLTWSASGRLTNLDDEAAEFTVKVTVARTESSGSSITVTEELGRVESGETVDFDVVGSQVLTFEPVCSVDVRGPLPFGVDLDF